MKILFVVLSPIEGNTSGILSNIGLINGLLELGHSVEILTTKLYGNNVYNKNIMFANNNYKISRLETNDLYKAVVNNRISDKTVKTRFLSILRKIYYKFKILDNALPIAKKVKKDNVERMYYDLIISASDPKSSHIVVDRLKKQGIHYYKWVQYWGDPLTCDITRKNVWPKYIVKKIEARLIKNSDKICYVSPFTCEEQKNEFKKLAYKMFFLPLPYEREKKNSKTIYNKEKVCLGYFGDYNSNIRNIIPLYNACKKDKRWCLTIAGGSDLKLKKTKNITILPRIPKEDIEGLEDQCDIIVCILNIKGTQIPGKIYYAAATSKTILVIVDGNKKNDIKNYLEKFDRFEICNNNEVEIAEAIIRIVNEKRDYRSAECFAPSTIAKELLKECGW